MLAIKRLVTILVMLFVLLGLLLVLVPSVRTTFSDMFSNREVGLYYALFIAALVLLGLQLITENLDSALLRREVAAHNSKVNELKARLYDHQADQRAREFQQRPTATTAVPPVTPAAEPVRPAPTSVHDVQHPVFPQSDPGLANVPLDQPNVIITPSPTSDPTNRPAL